MSNFLGDLSVFLPKISQNTLYSVRRTFDLDGDEYFCNRHYDEWSLRNPVLTQATDDLLEIMARKATKWMKLKYINSCL
jgi:hypothetical protein